jgi:enediyne biosynthesis protein E4
MPKNKRYIFSIFFFVLVGASCRQSESASGPLLFESLPSSATNISFVNKPLEKKLFNILYYLYYYNGGGVATGDINNDGLPDVYFTANNKGANKLYLNKGDLKFEDITEKAGVGGSADWCTGVTMADVNGDGFLDIYVSTVSGRYGLNGRNELYINNKNTTFTESAEKYGLNTSCFTTQSIFFDYDHDNDLDCFILNQSHHPHANIVDTGNRRKYDSLSGDRLYRNDISATGKFTDISKQAGIYQSNLGYGLGIAVSDLNNDGWEDIYVGNDFHENDYYYINNKNGTFTESGAMHFRHYSRFSMGNDIADYNNDGQLDVVTVDMLPPDEKTLKTYGSDENPDIYRVKLSLRGYQDQYSKNCLQRNNVDGISFSETALQSGVSATDWSWAPLFADFDNDGKKDLFVSSGIVKRPVDLDYVKYQSGLNMQGMDKTDKFDQLAIDNMPEGASHPFFFHNEDGETFKDVSMNWGTGNMKGFYNGASYADLDNDGDLDMVINCINSTAIVLKNKTQGRKGISVSFKGSGMNTFGIGCKAWLVQRSETQYQQLMLTRGFESSSDTRLHFTLDSTDRDASLFVIWPDFSYQVIGKIGDFKSLVVKQSDAKPGDRPSPPLGMLSRTKAFTDISSQVKCDWKHRENDFNDFNVQYLIPHMESTRGPKLAVADVNNDGLDDFYACGAKEQPGCLMMQQKNGQFTSTNTDLFGKYALAEDVDAIFFDANGDKVPDLLVASGGNEPAAKQTIGDRLFLNNGKGQFAIVENSGLPAIYENRSCVKAADIDNDGDQDLFLGTLASPSAYGIPQTSYLYLNDGTGHFKRAGTDIIGLEKIGIVTTASFTDINKDGWADLVVSGEWMPVKIFINQKGKFSTRDINHSTGLWQTVHTTDFNGDGYEDILAGNWGHNSKLWSGKNGPLKLYIKDFDNNGSMEQVMAYTVNNEEFPFLAKDELERALPVLKKAYLKYSDVAGKTLQYMFFDLFKNYVELKAETLSTSVFINDGKGIYERKDLPAEMQLAPVMVFAPFSPSLGTNYWAGGNYYGVMPYEGRYDALLPTTVGFDKELGIFATSKLLPELNGELRDIKWLNYGGEQVLVLAMNNQGLKFIRPIKKSKL